MKNYIKRYNFISWLIGNIYGLLFGLLGFFYRIKYIGSCTIAWSARIVGWKNLRIGKGVVLCHDTWINVSHRKSANISISIGDKSFVGVRNFFSVGNSIDIGSYFLTASNCSFIGASHIVDDPFSPYLSTGVTQKNDIIIEENCFFGYGSSVVGNVRIGRGSIIGAHAVVLGDIPPFSIVIGNPAHVVKRFDFKSGTWTKEFDGLDESLVPSREEYKETLDKKSFNPLFTSILASRLLSSIY
ncbi:acyltransferase [Gallaecimonas pentaromativorans]|uniref:Transferase family hexapeptide repeat protein n=1 Tax=Gallaecimonas pentaromativorans TaxID=584787 RepID=A0A3N1NUL6_9GAMM|nr:acyltransferase [Gallaecimonas pentaromativorans]ROQ22532.1 transferase family hexapeptide repeat protein [Gallaecimonas pentaromativorans]